MRRLAMANRGFPLIDYGASRSMFWFTIVVFLHCLVGLFVWFFSRRKESEILKALAVLSKGEHDEGMDSVGVCDLLATAGKALSDHSEQLGNFERSLLTTDTRRPEFSSLGEIREANQSVEQTIDTTLAGLMASCGDLLSEEQSSLKAYREKNSELGSTLEDIKHVELLVEFASTLLGMVRELRTENKAVRDEVAFSREKMIHLLKQASSAEHIARIDTLTQLGNRRAFDEAHSQCEKLRDQSGHPYSVILLDIDHFKSVNDQHGHAAGDAVLSLVSRILRENTKTSDHLCRLGGEEFGILLPRCEEKPARSIAESHRNKIEKTVLRFGNHDISVTVSCGVALAISGTSQSDLLARADAALYTAKREGRNRTCVAVLDKELQDSVSVE